MIGAEAEFSDSYNRDIGGNTVIDRDLEQHMKVLREGAENPMKHLIEIGHIVLIRQILHCRLSSFASCAGHYHDRFSFGNSRFDGDKGIVFYQLPCLFIILGDEFPLISRKKVLIDNGGGGTANKPTSYRGIALPFFNPTAPQQDGVMIVQVFGDQPAALLERKIITQLIEKPREPIESDGLTQTGVLVIGKHKLWRRQVIDDKSLAVERISHNLGLFESQIDAHSGQRRRIGRVREPVD